eukprot:95286-Amphidinium_carterae.1
MTPSKASPSQVAESLVAIVIRRKIRPPLPVHDALRCTQTTISVTVSSHIALLLRKRSLALGCCLFCDLS